jgi:predicted phage terminase large subunit-like protein
LNSGAVRDYAALARLGQVSRARITQIMSLLHLAPDLQEKILFLPRVQSGRDRMHLDELQALTALLDWQEQRRALDPSKGKDAEVGDYSALVKLGRDKNGILYVEADLKRRPTPQLIADSVEMVRLFEPDAFSVETNQFQELLAAEFWRVAEQQKVHLPIFGINNQTNKEVRIRRLGTYLAQRLFRFKRRSPATALLVQQLMDFPVGDHDDGPDGLEMALRTMIEQWNARIEASQRRVIRLVP